MQPRSPAVNALADCVMMKPRQGSAYLPPIAPGRRTRRRRAMQPHTPAVRALAPGPAPVEYAVAVDRYLAGASLGAASRRVYRISLTSWAWPLVGRQPPQGPRRRGAMPPVVPLALLDRAGTPPRPAAPVPWVFST